MSFLDMVTNFTGACIVLLLLAMKDVARQPCPSIAHQSYAYFDPDRHFLYDTLDLTMRNLQPGDTVLLIVRELKVFTPEDKKKQVGQWPRPKSQPDTVVAAPPSPGKCGMGYIASAPECDDNGTPSDRSDDTYTFSVTLNAVGECATRWQDQNGRTGDYNKPALYGPFSIKSGSQSLIFKDLNKKEALVNVTVKPPEPCAVPASNGGNPGGGPIVPPMAGRLNFYLEFDEPAGQRVSIFVEKGGATVWGRNPDEPGVGSWKNGKGVLSNRKTGFESVTQYSKYAPGTYKIYGRYRKGSAPNAKAKLYIASKDKAAQNLVSEHTLPKDQKVLLQTVEISTDGSIKMLK